MLTEIITQITAADLQQTVQVCISDNCSTDGTDIVYNKNVDNIGADRNFLKCVEIAHAEFCWLMGSDDLLTPNAIVTVLEKLKRHNNVGVMIGRRIACNKELKPLFSDQWIKSDLDFVCNFGNESEVINL